MNATIEQMIRDYAFELWVRAGRPDGSNDKFWSAARAEIERKERTGVRMSVPVPRHVEVRHESATDWRMRRQDPAF
jgi:Protein of unknown function (DUF2934)